MRSAAASLSASDTNAPTATAWSRERLSSTEAIRKAALLRFRPIMMTTAAALLTLGTGTGAEIRQPLGDAILLLVALASSGFWLIDHLLTSAHIAACVEAGHSNCVPRDLHPAQHWW